jgi:hypothetical protein
LEGNTYDLHTKGLLMKMNRQAQTFAKQVQVDLLALSDADLFKTVHFWVQAGLPYEVAEETRSALGYTRKVGEPTASVLSALAGSELEPEVQWLAPTPQKMRELLTEMDLKLFIQHVLPLAFQALHASHPEWSEGSTFNAHLANYLRGISLKRS